MNDDAVRILLIEDETAHAELVERAFELQGDRVRLNSVRSVRQNFESTWNSPSTSSCVKWPNDSDAWLSWPQRPQ